MKIVTDAQVKPGCYLMAANGQVCHGGEIKDFVEAGASRGTHLEIIVNPIDEAAMREKTSKRRKAS